MAKSLQAEFRAVHAALAAASDRSIASAAAHYALAHMREDVIVNGILDGGQPLALSTWRTRTGLSELPPIVWRTDRGAWAARLQVDVAALRAYAQAVYAATDAYLTRHADLGKAELTARVLHALLLNQGRLLRQTC